MTTTRPADSLPDDFRDVLLALREAGAEFLIVGAHALAHHGYVRGTLDLDLLVRPTEENAQRVIAALAAFGAPLEAHGVTAADFSRPGSVYQLGLPPLRIDVLTEISGVSFDDAWRTRVSTEVDGVAAEVIGREALLANKRATDRPKDRVDVRHLESG